MTHNWESGPLAWKRVTTPEGLTVDLFVKPDPDCPDFDCAEAKYTAEQEAACRRGDWTFVAVYLVPVIGGQRADMYASAHEIPFGRFPGAEPFTSEADEAEELMRINLSLLLQWLSQDLPYGASGELAAFAQYVRAYDSELVTEALADPWVREHAGALAVIHRTRGSRSADVDDATYAGLSERWLASAQPPGCWYLTTKGAGVMAALDAATA
jgi:hypothetical protein